MSAYATESADAVMVSKSLSYGSLQGRISTDLSIYQIHQDIDYISSRVDVLSSELRDTSSLLCTAINSTSTLLSNHLKISVDALSTTVESDYIKKYGT